MSLDPDADTSALEQALSDPASVSVDGQSATAHPLSERIAAIDKIAANKAVQRDALFGLIPFRLQSPGGA